ncbi:unnamed protein product, partial [Candidula unifasciata]
THFLNSDSEDWPTYKRELRLSDSTTDPGRISGVPVIDRSNPQDVFQAILQQVTATSTERSFTNVLQHLLNIKPGNEALSESIWQAVEKLVSKAAAVASEEDAHKLVTCSFRDTETKDKRGEHRESSTDIPAHNNTVSPGTLLSSSSTSLGVISSSSKPPQAPPLPPAIMSGAPQPPPPPPVPGIAWGPPPPPPPPNVPLPTMTVPDLPQFHVPRPRSRMKTLQWQKIPVNNVVGKSNIWTIIGHLDKKYEMDYERMDELFSLTNENSPKRSKIIHIPVTTCPQVNLLDGKRSLNVSIFLKQFKLSHQEIVQLIREGRCDKFGAERLKSLLKLLPSQEEIDAINAYTGDRDKLGIAEKFFICIMKLPNYRMRIEGLLMMEEFNINMEWIRPSIEFVIQAARDIQASQSLKELIYLILISGNYLNSGNYAGNAAGFKLSSLLKLTEIRANKPGMNLMHYVAQEAEEKNPKLLKFPQEMKCLKDAAQVSVESLTTDINNIAGKVRAITEQIVCAGADFQQQMAFFLKEANFEVVELEQDLKDIEKIRVELATFFCEDVKSFKLEECFKIMQTFCERLQKATEENIQRRIQEARAEKRKISRDMEMEQRRHSRDNAELLDQSMEVKDGSLVNKLLADVRSGYSSSRLNDGNFSVTRMSKVSLSPADKSSSLLDITDGRTRQQRLSVGSSVEDLFSSSDSLAQKGNRRSYAFGDDESLLNFLKDTSDSPSDLDKESRFERYSSLRKKRMERTGRKSSTVDAYEFGRERSSLTNLTDVGISSTPISSTIAGVKMRQSSSAKNDRPKSEVFSDDTTDNYPLRRSQSFLDRSSLDRRQHLKDDDDDESEALIRRLKQKLGRASGRETPSISEEAGDLAGKEISNSSPADSTPSTRRHSRWRSGIDVSENSSPSTRMSKYSFSMENITGSNSDKTSVIQNVENSLPSEMSTNSQPNSDLAQNQSFSVSMRKQISSVFGTDIDGILKTIEDTGRQIDTVGVTGPMKRNPEPTVSNSSAQPQVAVVAHVMASNNPSSPIIDSDLKGNKGSKKAGSTATVRPTRIMSDSRKDIKRVNNTSNGINRTRSGNFIRRSASVPRTPPPPQVRLCKSTMRSENEKSGNTSTNNKKEVAKTGKVEARNKMKDNGNKTHNGSRAAQDSSTKSGDTNMTNELVNLRVQKCPETLNIDSTNTSTETLQAISPVLQPHSLLDNSADDSESSVAAIAKWRMKRAQQRRSMGDIIDETDNSVSLNYPANSLRNDAGSRFSFASYNDNDEGFETSSGTMSQRTSMNSVLEADIQNNVALSRLAGIAKQNSPDSPSSDILSDVCSDNVFSPDSEQGTSGTDTIPSASSTKSSTSVKQKEASTVRKPAKTVPSYMQPTSSSASRPARTRVSSTTSGDSTASVPVIKRNVPSRSSVRDQDPGQPLKRDAARASMRAESASASFQRGTLARTSVRGPRSSLSVSNSSSTNSIVAPASPGRSRMGSSSSMSSLASSTSNITVGHSGGSETTNRRLASTSSMGAPIYRPTTPSFRSKTPTPQTSAFKKPLIIVSQTRTSTKPPQKSNDPSRTQKGNDSSRNQKSNDSSRTQTVRASSGRTSLGSTPTLNTDGRRSVIPFSNDNSRSSTPSLVDRPHSTTPLMSENKSSRRSSFMAPTASSRAKLDELSSAVPSRTQSLTSIVSNSSITRQGSLRGLNKSSTKTSGRQSPASTLLSPHGKPDHYQSLSTVAEQTGDEDKEDVSIKRSPSIMKKLIGRAKGSYPVSKTAAKTAVAAVKK